MSRTQRTAWYGIPILFCLAVHLRDLRAWFHNDDFTWLKLPGMVHSSGDLVYVLFAPMAEGTVRTLSERLFFLSFGSVFGLHSPPFRVWVFLTMFASIVLLMQVTWRLTGSAAAGFLAAIFWSANAGLAIALGWSAAYNEIAFAFVLLVEFRLLLLAIETDERRYWIAQWVVFVLGFGVLELNMMYPVLAAGYTWFYARRGFRKTLWLFVPSVLFGGVHLFLIPSPGDVYRPHFGAAMFGTFWRYWRFALGTLRDSKIDWRPLWLGLSCALAITLALAFFAIRKLRRGEWLPVFLLLWFAILILPVLPFRDHVTEYYVIAPAIGLAMLGGWGLSQARGFARGVACALAVLYLVLSIQDTTLAERFYYDRSRKMKYLMSALEELPKAGYSKKILLAGVSDDLFWSGFMDDPFPLIGLRQVYLAPGSERSIDAHPEWGGIARFTISPEEAFSALARQSAVVLELDGRRMRDVSNAFLPPLADFVAKHSQFVDAGDPVAQTRLGPSWFAIEGDHRWMPKNATMKLAGPEKPGMVLEVTGHCPEVLLANGPLDVTFSGDHVPIGAATLKQPGEHFDLQFTLPAALIGRPQIEIEIEVSRTYRPTGEQRDLGLIFGTFRIR